MSYPEIPVKPEDVVFDLDDFQMTRNQHGQVGDLSLGYLFYLKSLYPNFKITLFAIPNRCTPEILAQIKSLGWIHFGVHGWQHDTNYECAEMTKDEALAMLSRVEMQYGDIYEKGFKAPGWQIGTPVYEALLERGYWVADHVYNDDRRPQELPVYKLDHPWCIHGHTWDIEGVPEDQRNGIRQLIEERGLDFTPETRFHFISEVVKDGDTGSLPREDETGAPREQDIPPSAEPHRVSEGEYTDSGYWL